MQVAERRRLTALNAWFGIADRVFFVSISIFTAPGLYFAPFSTIYPASPLASGHGDS